MESTGDKIRAFVLALALHVGLVAVLFLGLWWSRPPQTVSVAGPVIEAVLVTEPGTGRSPPRPSPPRPAPPPKPAPPAPEPEAPPPQPEPTPSPQQADTPPQPQPQAPVPKPDTREQERVARLAQQQAETKAREEAAERHRQEQILLEQQAQKEDAERRERLRQQAEERERKLADIKRQREAAEKASRLAQERLQQLQDRRAPVSAPSAAKPEPGPPAPAPARAGNEGVDESLLGQYIIAIQRAVEHNWLRPETVRPGQPCKIRIRQIVGGEVIGVTMDPSCPYDDLGRRSVEAAVLKAQPLPYTGFESVFRPDLLFTFVAPEG